MKIISFTFQEQQLWFRKPGFESCPQPTAHEHAITQNPTPLYSAPTHTFVYFTATHSHVHTHSAFCILEQYICISAQQQLAAQKNNLILIHRWEAGTLSSSGTPNFGWEDLGPKRKISVEYVFSFFPH